MIQSIIVVLAVFLINCFIFYIGFVLGRDAGIRFQRKVTKGIAYRAYEEGYDNMLANTSGFTVPGPECEWEHSNMKMELEGKIV